MDLSNFKAYKEGNRLEAKDARGGLPRSLWETYSSFANTVGGAILLGVSEDENHGLHIEGLDNYDRLLDNFWNQANNPQKVSACVIGNNDVEVVDAAGKATIVIHVPRADRRIKPVFINGNPLTGTYRRNHSGDYRCSREEIQSMMRDAAAESQDAKVLDRARMEDLDADSIRGFRKRYDLTHEDHPWSKIDDDAFLCRIGAAGTGEDGETHPTGAGLLMFGQDWCITQEYPHYFLDYRPQLGTVERWEDRFTSQTGDWSGNIYDFYYRAYNKNLQRME